MDRTFSSFEELLEQGRFNFEINPNSNITGLEEGTRRSIYVSILKNINYYMYTTYSTNVGDKVFSIEGIIPLNVFKKIEPKLLEQGYWYVAANPLDNKIYGVNLISSDEFDPNLSYDSKLEWINDRDKNKFGENWMPLCQTVNTTLYMNNKIDIHFLPPNDENISLDDCISYEALGYTEKSLFQGTNPLINLTIEDPIVGRISLYSKLLTMLEWANNSN
jgi:hypothetical protein